MPVAIDEVEVEVVPPATASAEASHSTPAKPDPREIQRAHELADERRARVRAH